MYSYYMFHKPYGCVSARRMLKAVGCCIIYLKRISMGEITLDESLKPGEWKEISIRKGYDSSES